MHKKVPSLGSCQFLNSSLHKLFWIGARGGELRFQFVHQGHELIDFGHDAMLFGKGRERVWSLPRTMILPLMSGNSSRICVVTSQPAFSKAGVMNFVQMSRSLRSFLFMQVQFVFQKFLIIPIVPLLQDLGKVNLINTVLMGVILFRNNYFKKT
jgi:hypothetical protein